MCQDIIQNPRFSLARRPTMVDPFLTPTSFIEILTRKETAILKCYRHHDPGFLGQLSRLRNDLTMPGPSTPRIPRKEVTIPYQQTIEHAATSTSRRKINICRYAHKHEAPVGKTDQPTAYRHDFLSQCESVSEEKVQLWILWCG